MNATMTQIGIDKSHLPHVYDVCECFSVLEDGALAHCLQEQEIERFYSSNVQKNHSEQNDVRLARRLHDEEEERVRLTHQLQQLEKQDCEYAREIQEELRRCDEEARRREEEDEEMAKQLQDEEELKIRQERAESGHHDDVSPLSHGWRLWEQMMQDADLARRLQEEEDKQPHWRTTDTDMDFHTVQVAQDEELARYMQRQEKKGNRWSRDLLALERSHDPSGTGGKMLRERLNSEGLHSPVEEEQSLDPNPLIPTCTTLHHRHTHPFYNIAEELDPTFTGKKPESRVSSGSSPGICLAPRTPHSVFYDYLPEPSVAPPSRRHANKPGRHKAKEKRKAVSSSEVIKVLYWE